MKKLKKETVEEKLDRKEVRQIPYEQAIPWFLEKHYAHRIPSVSWAFGFYIDGILEGVVSYGTPASSTLLSGVCGKENADKVIELNRLVINEGVPKNSASYLVGGSLKLLPKPKIVVSYADTKQGHVGYIYQATNFIYTGLSSKFLDPKVKGLEKQHHATYAHGMTNEELKKKYGDKLYFEERARKHRYIYFVGCSELKEKLNYKVEPYPKGKTTRYDSGKKLATQEILI
jgi:hypothetical protein